MSDDASEGRRRIDWTTFGLAVTGAFAAASVVFFLLAIPTGTRFLMGTPVGDKREAATSSLKAAATKQVNLLLNQDYHSAQKTLDALIDGATGDLRKAYAAGAVTQINLAGELKAVASGKILKVAVMRQDESTAELIVIASQKIRNIKTAAIMKSATCPAATLCRYYRFLVTYERVAGDWKMSGQDYLAS